MVGAVLLVSLSPGTQASAEPAGAVHPHAAVAPAEPSTGVRVEEFSAQSRERRRRRPPRVHIYTPHGPGPNSVRICHSHYEYEHRLSGTVIVPRESCYWQGWSCRASRSACFAPMPLCGL